jgi:squalene-hopene/tetraprenyl-beta-curcumene cyclase
MSDALDAPERVPSDGPRELIGGQAERLLAARSKDGCFLFELEADVTIPSEFILLHHFLGEPRRELEGRLAAYIEGRRNDDGSWPLYFEGEGDLSATVKAYWALKLVGLPEEAPTLRRARAWILAAGGAERANVFTRILMALFRQVPWRAAPAMPVEIMLLPEWAPFHVSKIAYWSRTVMTPLLILMALRARAANPTGLGIRELFREDPASIRNWQVNPTGAPLGELFLGFDALLRRVEPLHSRSLRRRALARAEAYMLRRLNGEDGLGAIYPAMAYAVMAMRALGYGGADPRMVEARAAIDRLLVDRGEEVYPQPCVSPVWDTALSAHALLEAGAGDDPRLIEGLDWLAGRQVLDRAGDWALRRPGLRPGGWAFQHANPDFPDVDDTAVVASAMHRVDPERYATNIARACEWLAGMQSANGGWGAFDADNDAEHLNSIPFADHGALLDPPTVDVTARCVGALAQVDRRRHAQAIRRGVGFLRRTQEPDGSWFGRWGANYVYGTWSALTGLRAAGEDMSAPHIRRAVDWLVARQREDGGWGEGLESYEGRRDFARASTPSQTAWGLLALLAADEAEHPAARRAEAWLREAPREAAGPRWREEHWTGTGFPRVFYLKYHGYAAYFPLMALARRDRLTRRNDRAVWGF